MSDRQTNAITLGSAVNFISSGQVTELGALSVLVQTRLKQGGFVEQKFTWREYIFYARLHQEGNIIMLSS